MSNVNVKVSTPLKFLVIVPFIQKGVWDGINWITLVDIEFILNGKKHTIRRGFVTDFGSIPSLARVTINRMGKAAVGFVIHDWLRIDNEILQVCSTKEADQALYDIGRMYGEGRYTMGKIYYSLRMFGWTANVGENQYFKIDLEVIKYICSCNNVKIQ